MNAYEQNTETVRVPKAGSEWLYHGSRKIRVAQVVVKWEYVDGGTYDASFYYGNVVRFFEKNRGAYGFTPVEPRYEVGKTYEMRSFLGDSTWVFKVFSTDDEKAYGVATFPNGGETSAVDARHENFNERVVGEM